MSPNSWPPHGTWRLTSDPEAVLKPSAGPRPRSASATKRAADKPHKGLYVKIPLSLHRELGRRKWMEGRTKQDIVVAALEQYLGTVNSPSG